MAAQQGVEGQLGVFVAGFQAFARAGGGFGLVVDDQRGTVGQAVHSVQRAVQGQLAEPALDPVFGLLEHRAGAGLVLRQPAQVAGAQRRPGDAKRQELALVQRLRALGLLRGGVHQGHPVGGRIGLQGLVKALQHLVQPGAEIAFVDVHVQLADLLQAQLAQREEAVGAGAQHLVGAGRQGLGGQGRAAGRGPGHRLGDQRARLTRIVAGQALPVQTQGLHQGRGQQVFAAVVAGAPQHIQPRHLQGHGPGALLRLPQLLARGQVQGQALRGAPGAGRFGRGGQTGVVGAGQHQGRERAPEELAERQHHDLGVRRVRRAETGRLQRVGDPACELGQAHAALRGRPFLPRGLIDLGQAQRGQQGGAGRVGGQQRPLPTALQQRAQLGQPLGQAAGAGLPGRAQGVDLLGQRFAGAERGGLRPAAHGVAAQALFEPADRGGVKSGGQLQPIQHRVAGSTTGASAQRHHQLRGGVGGGQAPAGLVAQPHAARGQQRTDPARQQAIAGHQGHRHAPLGQVAQHAGGGALGLVLAVGGGVQPGHGRRGVHPQGQRHELLGVVLGQAGGERIGLQALDDEQRVQRLGRARREQHVGGVVGRAGPGHGDAAQGGFQRQRAGAVLGQRRQGGVGLRGPVGAPGGRHAGRHLGQLAGLLQQWAGQPLALRAQARAVQQRGGGEQIAPVVEAHIVRPGREQADTRRPVARGLEARREAVGKTRRPARRQQRHQLGVGQQHHAARWVRRQLAQLAGQLVQQAVPGRQNRRGGGIEIVFSYRRHSVFWYRPSPWGKGVSVTITALYPQG